MTIRTKSLLYRIYKYSCNKIYLTPNIKTLLTWLWRRREHKRWLFEVYTCSASWNQGRYWQHSSVCGQWCRPTVDRHYYHSWWRRLAVCI